MFLEVKEKIYVVVFLLQVQCYVFGLSLHTFYVATFHPDPFLGCPRQVFNSYKKQTMKVSLAFFTSIAVHSHIISSLGRNVSFSLMSIIPSWYGCLARCTNCSMAFLFGRANCHKCSINKWLLKKVIWCVSTYTKWRSFSSMCKHYYMLFTC